MPKPRRPSAEAERWFARLGEVSREISASIAAMSPTERSVTHGRGAGGDVTTGVDRVAEDLMLATLETAAREEGNALTVVSEEAGVLDMPGAGARRWVVVDPVDGSQNAKRGAPLFATSVAVAQGPLMGDVTLAFVHDHSTGQVFTAERGRGAWLDGVVMPQAARPSRLRLLAVEGASATRIGAAADTLIGEVGRLRALGSMALSMCWVAAGRMDGLLGLGAVRAVDVAAAQLVLRETGCWIGLPEAEDLDGCPLDVTSRRRVMATAEIDLVPRLRAALAAAPDG